MEFGIWCTGKEGYSPEDSTWEKAENCTNATTAVQEYHDRVTRMTTYHAQGDTGQVDYSVPTRSWRPLFRRVSTTTRTKC
jgi:hypothetical protein